MNEINPNKLLNSKWTASTPLEKEKHFMVTDVEFDEDDEVVLCVIEALLTKRSCSIDRHDLKDDSRWIYGWK